MGGFVKFTLSQIYYKLLYATVTNAQNQKYNIPLKTFNFLLPTWRPSASLHNQTTQLTTKKTLT